MTISLPGGIIASIPASMVCVLFTALMVALSQSGLWLFTKWGKHERLEQSNDVAGIVFGVIGLLYSLVLAFVVIAVWGDYNDLQKNVQTETDNLNSILSQSSGLPDEKKELIGGSISDYCDQVINQEWQMQKEKASHPSAIPALRHELLTTIPENEIQKRVYDALDKDLSAVTDLRRARLSHTRSQMPPLVWQILITGTALLILFTYLFNVLSVKLKRIYLGFLVTSVSMCMFLLDALDHPFDGEDGVSNLAYRNVQEEVKAYLPAPAANAEAQAAINSFSSINYNHSKIP